MCCGNIQAPKIIPPEIAPYQSKGAERVPIITSRRSTLMMIEDPASRIIGPTDIVDDPIISRRNPLRRTATYKLRFGKQPCENYAGEKFVGVKTARMCDEEIGVDAGFRILLSIARVRYRLATHRSSAKPHAGTRHSTRMLLAAAIRSTRRINSADAEAGSSHDLTPALFPRRSRPRGRNEL